MTSAQSRKVRHPGREALTRFVRGPGRGAPAFLLVAALAGFAAIGLGVDAQRAQGGVVIAWVMGSLALLGWFDATAYRIEPWWLAALAGAAAVWQAQAAGPEPVEGLLRALAGAGVGFALGALPIGVAEALGRRWPFSPGDALLFAGLGVLVGPLGVLWTVFLGGLVSLARHRCVQRRRGRSWTRGHVALGPGMAAAAAAVFVGSNYSVVAGAGG